LRWLFSWPASALSIGSRRSAVSGSGRSTISASSSRCRGWPQGRTSCSTASASAPWRASISIPTTRGGSPPRSLSIRRHRSAPTPKWTSHPRASRAPRRSAWKAAR